MNFKEVYTLIFISLLVGILLSFMNILIMGFIIITTFVAITLGLSITIYHLIKFKTLNKYGITFIISPVLVSISFIFSLTIRSDFMENHSKSIPNKIHKFNIIHNGLPKDLKNISPYLGDYYFYETDITSALGYRLGYENSFGKYIGYNCDTKKWITY